MTVELFEKIPNNVNLSADKRLQRALEQWLPNYISWWKEMGPDQFQGKAMSTCAPPSASKPMAGRTSTTFACRNIAGASSWSLRFRVTELASFPEITTVSRVAGSSR